MGTSFLIIKRLHFSWFSVAALSMLTQCKVFENYSASIPAGHRRKLSADVEDSFTLPINSPYFLPKIPRMDRWIVGEKPLFRRKLGLQWFDMCAESLGMPKVALMFLTRGPVHQEALWTEWLERAKGRVLLPKFDRVTQGTAKAGGVASMEEDMDATLRVCKEERSTHRNVAKLQHMFTVYLHPSDPNFHPESGSIFAEAVVPNRLPDGQYYKNYHLVEAGLSMLAAALEDLRKYEDTRRKTKDMVSWNDRLNQRFVMLCESTIPLYPPALIYHQLLHEAKSRLGLYHPNIVPSDFTPGYWHEAMATKHGIGRQHFRKNNHRTALIRKHANMAVQDLKLRKSFYMDCSDCLVEEHYLATVLGAHNILHEAYPKAGVMFEDWIQSVEGHPHDYDPEEVTPDFLYRARSFQLSRDWFISDVLCNESQDSSSVTIADSLMDTYDEATTTWNIAPTVKESFPTLGPDCLMFARKFKKHTSTAVMDLWRHEEFVKWNYSGRNIP